jgi:GDP-L-fucose synthase
MRLYALKDCTDQLRSIHGISVTEIIESEREGVFIVKAKVANAPSVAIWGSGTPRREFLYVDDMAAASVFVMGLDKAIYDQNVQPMESHINVGFGSDVTILELAQTVSKAVGYEGKINTDPSKPDGAPRKWMDSSRLNKLGWKPEVGLSKGLALAYADMLRAQN